MNKSGPYISLADAARRLGVSGKALRLYEAQGLVTPERTAAGWRVYGPQQIARLHRVLALKSFGFPLARIGELLSGKLPDLENFLELHAAVLRQEVQRLEHALQLLSAAQGKLARHGSLSSDDLIDLTKETVMTDKRNELAATYEAIANQHLSAEDKAVLSANGYRGMDQPDTGWDRLYAEAARLMASNDPGSPEAMDLARRWMGKVFEGTGGNTALTQKMKTVARETLEQPVFKAASTSSVEMMDFVAQAYGAAIAAGLMPDPRQA